MFVTSIYEHVRAHIDTTGPGLLPGGDELPGTAPTTPGGLRFAPGAMDNILLVQEEFEADELIAVARAARDAEGLHSLDDWLATRPGRLSGPLLVTRHEEWVTHPHQPRWVAEVLTQHSANVESVKAAMCLLGAMTPTPEGDAVLLTLARHEEFTWFATLGFSARGAQGNEFLFRMAQCTTAWGRIACIERLQPPVTEQIATWLLEEGFRNDVMIAYTALECATLGRLPQRVDHIVSGVDARPEALDSALLLYHGIAARDSPYDLLHSWPDGWKPLTRLLRHARVTPGVEARLVLVAHDVVRTESLTDPDIAEPDHGGEELLAVAREVLEDARLREVAVRRVSDPAALDSLTLHMAYTLGIDPFESVMAALAEGRGDFWIFLSQSEITPERARRIVDLALSAIDWGVAAPGPTTEHELRGGTPEVTVLHVMQALRAEPEIAWPVVRAALRGRTPMMRSHAAAILEHWPVDDWSEDVAPAVREAMEAEPVPDVRARLGELLSSAPSGQPGTIDAP